jgi:hypothetical protein
MIRDTIGFDEDEKVNSKEADRWMLPTGRWRVIDIKAGEKAPTSHAEHFHPAQAQKPRTAGRTK